MKFVDNFYDWANTQFTDFMETTRDKAVYKANGDGKDVRYELMTYGKKIIIIDKETGKTGTAQCKKGEKFISIVGLGVAWARLKGEEIPKEREVTRIKTLKVGDRFIIVNNKNFKETYTFIGRYNFESIDKCFCATGEKLEKLAAFYSDTVVIKL